MLISTVIKLLNILGCLNKQLQYYEAKPIYYKCIFYVSEFCLIEWNK